MAELNLKISAEVVWIKEDGDCSICVVCGDMIFGNKYSIGLNFSFKKEIDIHLTNICESCAGAIKQDWREKLC